MKQRKVTKVIVKRIYSKSDMNDFQIKIIKLFWLFAFELIQLLPNRSNESHNEYTQKNCMMKSTY